MFVFQLYIVLEGIVVVFGAIRSVIISCASITALAVAGLRAVPLTSALGLLLGGVILRYLVAIAFIGCIPHVYVISRGGFPVPYRCWFMFVSYIVAHTVDVFGAVI